MSVIADLPHNEYLAMPALSFSGMKQLLPPSCPALFKYWREHQRPSKTAYDFGHVAHSLVLGAGPEIVAIDADDWRTKDARTQRDEAYTAGQVPVLASDYAAAEALAESVKAHPRAAELLRPGSGKPEVSLFWTDEESGVDIRGRLDWLPNPSDGRMVVPDFKTAASADPETFAQSAAKYGYAQQAALYIDGLKALGLSDDPVFVFIVAEKSAPYLVSVIELDAEALRIGRGLNRRAIQIYKHCTQTNTWPGYSPDVELISMPVWYQRQHEEFTEMNV